jgi:lipoprotein-anchoring transpeptidase ErfK/SrfK
MAGGTFRNAAFACSLGMTFGFGPAIASSAPLAMVDTSHVTFFDQALRDQPAGEPEENQLPAELRRQTVAYPTPESPGTIVIDTPHTYLYYALGGGRAIRYAIEVARAVYLGDTQYRIHGTNDPTAIGQKVSSGCVRLTNEDVIDLYGRATLGAKVVVLPDTARRLRDEDAARSEDRRMSSRQAAQPGPVAFALGIY